MNRKKNYLDWAIKRTTAKTDKKKVKFSRTAKLAQEIINHSWIFKANYKMLL